MKNIQAVKVHTLTMNHPVIPFIKYRVHGTLLNQPDEQSMMEKINFSRNSEFSAKMVIFGQKYPFSRMAENSQ